MVWSILTHLAEFIVDLAVSASRAESAKDLEIALLRHQLRLLQRRSPRPVLAINPSGLVPRPRSSLLIALSAG